MYNPDLFQKFLEEQTIKLSTIPSRINRAFKAEDILGLDLDSVTASDDKMYESLLIIKAHPMEHHGNIQNSVRWYYKFKHGKEFPKLKNISKYSLIGK